MRSGTEMIAWKKDKNLILKQEIVFSLFSSRLFQSPLGDQLLYHIHTSENWILEVIQINSRCVIFLAMKHLYIQSSNWPCWKSPCVMKPQLAIQSKGVTIKSVFSIFRFIEFNITSGVSRIFSFIELKFMKQHVSCHVYHDRRTVSNSASCATSIWRFDILHKQAQLFPRSRQYFMVECGSSGLCS